LRALPRALGRRGIGAAFDGIVAVAAAVVDRQAEAAETETTPGSAAVLRNRSEKKAAPCRAEASSDAGKVACITSTFSAR